MRRSTLYPLVTGIALAVFQTAAALAVAPAPAVPKAADTRGLQFFESRIRPVLSERCYACHSAKSGKSMGGLRLDSAAAIRKGGDSGMSLTALQPGGNQLLKALHYDGLRMPPQGKLPAPVVADFEQWVQMGAPLPADAEKSAAPAGIDIEAGRRHWAFQPVRALPTPKVSNAAWPRKKIDSFILQKLDQNGFRPAPEADRATWIRRVSIDLTGLPPTYEEVQAFLQDRSPKAYETWVDRLLASPRYGERWGRHWLDVARYAEDNPTSEASNQPPANPWRYRDWVIQALNDDVPYNEFVRRQLAADLIPNTRPADLAALGFLGLAPVYHKELMLARDVIEQIAADEWDERVDTISRGFLGLTVACARCHDHKYDPITTKDYYALAGIMASTQLVERPLVQLDPADAEKLAAAERQVRGLERDLRKKQRERMQLAARGGDTTKADAAIAEDQAQLEKLKATPHFGAPMAPAVRDAGLWVNGDNPSRTRLDYRPGVARDLPVFIRGSVSRTGEIVPRRFLAVLSPGQPTPFRGGSGRLELADAIVHEAAPLSARVIVNRVWGWHFGRPIVDTPSNFGRLGGAPTHPELLEDLAARFIQNGWSLKWLQREIVLSAAYRQSSANNADYYRRDSENRWLWRMNRTRMDPEAWRDSMLQVTGALDLTVGGPSANLEDAANSRRTVYGRVSRQRQADILRLFDFPDPNRHGEARIPTTTPTQQLYLMNSPFVQGQADRLADQVTAGMTDPEAGVRALYRKVLLRDPSTEERTTALTLLRSGAPDSGKKCWSMLAQALLISNGFLFAD